VVIRRESRFLGWGQRILRKICHGSMRPRGITMPHPFVVLPSAQLNFESTVPGDFIASVVSSPVFGSIIRFMYGAKHAAPELARRFRIRA
jgi:hypothetical protein